MALPLSRVTIGIGGTPTLTVTVVIEDGRSITATVRDGVKRPIRIQCATVVLRRETARNRSEV